MSMRIFIFKEFSRKLSIDLVLYAPFEQDLSNSAHILALKLRKFVDLT